MFKPLQDVPIQEGTVVEVLLPVEPLATRTRSIAGSPFAGMWKDREDMADPAAYIRKLREGRFTHLIDLPLVSPRRKRKSAQPQASSKTARTP